MEILFNTIIQNVQGFILILVRITGLFIASPIFSRNNVPPVTKIGLSIILTFIVFPLQMGNIPIEATSLLQLVYWVLIELSIGVIIGFVSLIFFNVTTLAGTIIDVQMGFGMVNIMDPQTNAQIPIMAGFYNILLTLIFLVVNGHHLLIKGLLYSYDILPIGSVMKISEHSITQVTNMFTQLFILAFQLSAPILITIFLSNILLGILARTMPQMNVFIVGLPLKILLGIVVVIISLGLLLPYSEKVFDMMFKGIIDLLHTFTRG